MEKTNLLPKISIITITYNAESYIERTLKSVIEQDYNNIEYIIIDGNSTDKTMSVVEKYKENIDVIVSEKDKGIYDAMNKGLLAASGDWINFLNAGDTFINDNVLSNLISPLSSKYSIIYGDWINVNDNGIYNYMTAHPKLNLKILKHNFLICHQSLFIKNINLPLYDTSYKIKADYQWVIDIVKKTNELEIQYINEPLVHYDIDGLSATKLLLNVKEYIKLTYTNFGIVHVILNIPIYSKYVIKDMIIKILTLKGKL